MPSVTTNRRNQLSRIGLATLLYASAAVLAPGLRAQTQNALVVEATRVTTDRDVVTGGKLQLGSLTPGSATCIAVASDRLYADLDCSDTKDAGEEFLDLAGGGGGGGGSSDPLSAQYHPNRPPSSCGAGGLCEEFTAGVRSQSWEWGNQGNNTVTLEMGGETMNIVSTAGDGYRCRWLTPPNGNWTASAKIHLDAGPSLEASGIALSVLRVGTVAAPTSLSHFLIFHQGTYGRTDWGRHEGSSYSAFSWVTGGLLHYSDNAPVGVNAQVLYDMLLAR